MVQDSSSPATITVTNAIVLLPIGYGRPSGTGVANVATLRGLDTSSLGATGLQATTVAHINIANIAATSVTTQIGIDIGALSRGSTDIGIRIALADTYSLQLSDTGGTAAGGITFGTDTTLYRSAANTLKTDDALSVTGELTPTGGITLPENASIALDPAGSADGKYTGITVAGTAGAVLAFGDLVYLAAVDSRWELADASAASTAGNVMLGMCVLAAAGDGSATTILLHGIIRADAAFPALTISAQVYVSETAGDIVVAQPTTTDAVIRVVGRALTADEIYFDPSEDYITHV